MPGLGTLADAPAVARILHAATGEDPDELRLVGQGVTTIGWRADTARGSYAVLVERPPEARDARARNEPTQYAARQAILEALAERGARSPRPVATARTIESRDPVDGRWDWMVTTWTEGEPPRDAIADEAARDLGRELALLHGLPVEGFGRLADEADRIRGLAPDREAGILSRWAPEAWPFDGRALLSHPIVGVAPQLVTTIAALRSGLMRFAEEPTQVAVCHTDLNASHLRVVDGRLSGLIDFGDAAIVPPGFDLASFAYYFGWPALERLLEGYTSNSILREIRLAEAHQLAVMLALQKVEKHRGNEERLAQAVAFLEETLPRAVRRDQRGL
jgi:Ser/Thr protein kinase RdoA (MazF antagonist)